MDPSFLNRNVNEGFSGGEKKRNEILQLAVLDVGIPLLNLRLQDSMTPCHSAGYTPTSPCPNTASPPLPQFA